MKAIGGASMIVKIDAVTLYGYTSPPTEWMHYYSNNSMNDMITYRFTERKKNRVLYFVIKIKCLTSEIQFKYALKLCINLSVILSNSVTCLTLNKGKSPELAC